MVSLNLAALFTVAAVVAFASSAVVSPTYVVPGESGREDDKTPISAPDFTDDYEDEDDKVTDDNEVEIDGIPLKYLLRGEVRQLLDKEDDIFANELEICMAREIVWERMHDHHSVVEVATVRRHKRSGSIAARLLTAGRNLFKGAVRAPKPTASGSRITQQYTKHGNFQNANQHFNSFRPDNVKSFSKNGISGRTGTVGKHRITVRDGSKQGSPTLEIRSPNPQKTEYVRKFRYQKQGKH